MIPFLIAMSLSVMQCGAVYIDMSHEMDQISGEQNNWKRMLTATTTAPLTFIQKAKQKLFMNLVPTGVAIGAGSANQFMKISRRTTFIGFNLLGIAACCLSIVNSYSTVIIGRFIYGFVAGVMLNITPKMLLETLPMDIYNAGYGASTNLVIEGFKIIDIFVNIQLYKNAASDSAVTVDHHEHFFTSWRIQFLLPVPFMSLALFVFIFFAKEETIEYYVKNNQKE
jgi:MFS family permease